MPDVPRLFDGMAASLAQRGAEFLMADAIDYPEFTQHAQPDSARLIRLTPSQVRLLDRYWGGQLRDRLRHMKKSLAAGLS